MPQRKTAVKDLKKSRKHRLHNIGIKTELKKTIKEFTALTATSPEEAKKSLSLLYKKLDKAAKRNILNKKTAARRKSLYARLLTKSSAPKA